MRNSIRFGAFANVLLLPFVQGCGSDDPSPYELDARRQPVVTSVSEFRELAPVAESLQETADGRIVAVALTKEQVSVSGDRPISQQERDEWRARLQEKIDPSPPKPESPTSIAVAHAAKLAANELVPLVLQLDEPGFDFRRFQMVKYVQDAEERALLRSDLLAEREVQLEQANRGVVRQRLTELRAEIKREL